MDPNHTDPPKGKALSHFKEPSHRLYSDTLENKEWNYEQSQKRNKFYLALIGVCVIGTIFVTVTSNYKTYVVRVNEATGAVEMQGQLKETNYTPREAEIRYYLAQYIRNIRTVPLDPVQYKVNWETASHFMSQEASNKLMEFLKRENFNEKLGRETVQPTIISMQLYPGTKNTYQVRWSEEEFNLSGTVRNQKKYFIGLFMINVVPPKKEADILVNPLGITIQDLTLDTESNTGESGFVKN